MNWLKIIFSLLAICAASYISFTLPISEAGIPFTAQSLVIFIVAGLLKPKEVLLVINAYYLLGIVGLPVFADGTSGIEKMMGPSGGFLYGFAFSSLFIASTLKFIEKKSFPHYLFIFLAATIVLFIFGLSHLGFKFGFQKALEYGFYPFWKMALVKAILATFLVYYVKR